MRKAKIICTLGPSSNSDIVLESMLKAGMDVARINFSHGTHEDHAQLIHRVRRIAQKLGRNVAILQDVQGPKIRLGRFVGGQLEVGRDQRVTVTTRRVMGDARLIPTPIKSLPKDVKPGDPILLDDGRVRLEVLAVEGTEVHCRVEVGGILKDRKGLNLPGAAVSVPTITAKDRKDLAFGQEQGVDFVALSFVRSAKDIKTARRLVGNTPIIAKIEKPQAVEAIDEITEAADGIMVARGDLGVEVPLERVPVLQKEIIRRVNAKGSLVIVATEMLESMVQHPRPTRAEVSDVANAVLDGADALMLSGETAAGTHPVSAVRTMCQVIEETEASIAHSRYDFSPFNRTRDTPTGVAAAAVAAADQLDLPLIVVFTETGSTALHVSEFRPRARILGLSPDLQTVRRMSLQWGVQGLHVARCKNTDQVTEQVRKVVRKENLCPKGGNVVVLTGVPLNEPGSTNMMTVVQVP
jgi:pyruvate kinase